MKGLGVNRVKKGRDVTKEFQGEKKTWADIVPQLKKGQFRDVLKG